jgi:hypothetical protein
MNAWALSAADVGPVGFVLVALTALAGALVIHGLTRRRGAGGVPPAKARTPVAAPSSAPEDVEIAGRLREVAERMGLPERVLPRACAPDGDGDFVWRDGARYRYQSHERGGPVADHADASLDEILYRVFRDRSWTHAYVASIGSDQASREARIAEQQRAMLAAANPAWAARI